ncbi:PIN domain-containing protein [Nostoc edaphicum]|uniref:PIN domain-containing protein n=1 Tax=Nostoc edaphicum TaxID=264686 RepID=UPI001EEA2FA5|nr:PIN domain-containing protein [Nostoc edaphicum]
MQRVEVVNLVASDAVLIKKIIEIRQQYRLKLPDTIIAAMAIQNSASLVTADQEFAKVTILTVIKW